MLQLPCTMPVFIQSFPSLLSPMGLYVWGVLLSYITFVHCSLLQRHKDNVPGQCAPHTAADGLKVPEGGLRYGRYNYTHIWSHTFWLPLIAALWLKYKKGHDRLIAHSHNPFFLTFSGLLDIQIDQVCSMHQNIRWSWQPTPSQLFSGCISAFSQRQTLNSIWLSWISEKQGLTVAWLRATVLILQFNVSHGMSPSLCEPC